MPIYEYRCTSCDHLAEVIHGINDLGPRFCESCGAEGTMRKGFGTPAVLYKGSGWARKDRPASRPAGQGRPDASSDNGAGTKGERDGSSGRSDSSAESGSTGSSGSSSSSGSSGSSASSGSSRSSGSSAESGAKGGASSSGD